jgi:hypothetical protein
MMAPSKPVTAAIVPQIAAIHISQTDVKSQNPTDCPKIERSFLA